MRHLPQCFCSLQYDKGPALLKQYLAPRLLLITAYTARHLQLATPPLPRIPMRCHSAQTFPGARQALEMILRTALCHLCHTTTSRLSWKVAHASHHHLCTPASSCPLADNECRTSLPSNSASLRCTGKPLETNDKTIDRAWQQPCVNTSL
ncbi:hypothetical protein BDU57DRAFT_189466 [Ampelomyces quisqualis]|uniref:Uncharacterized protein n=1 Tax=Ampelomyces quisqualis TaxID=50730 RepID=A0A6A5QQZ6_AMPQU|nr:hypothetical protein BDU57DRAFT_189466 [Ampelomyces quisqualis]